MRTGTYSHMGKAVWDGPYMYGTAHTCMGKILVWDSPGL